MQFGVIFLRRYLGNEHSRYYHKKVDCSVTNSPIKRVSRCDKAIFIRRLRYMPYLQPEIPRHCQLCICFQSMLNNLKPVYKSFAIIVLRSKKSFCQRNWSTATILLRGDDCREAKIDRIFFNSILKVELLRKRGLPDLRSVYGRS